MVSPAAWVRVGHRWCAAGSGGRVWGLQPRGCGLAPQSALVSSSVASRSWWAGCQEHPRGQQGPPGEPRSAPSPRPAGGPSLASRACGTQGHLSSRPCEGPGSAFLRAAETTFATTASWMLLGVSALSPGARGHSAAASHGVVGLQGARSDPPAGQAGRGAQGGAAEAGGGAGLPGRDRGRPLS